MEYFHGIGIADTMRRNTLFAAGICRRTNAVALVAGKDLLQLFVPLFHADVILVGQSGKDDPLGGIFDESLRLVDQIICLVLYLNRGIPMTDSGGGAKQYRRVILF